MKPVRYNRVNAHRPAVGSYFDDFFTKNITNFFGNDMPTAAPAVNIIEENNQYLIDLAAPGQVKEDFQVRIEQDHLIISAESKTEESTVELNFRRKEFGFSSFTRKFHLPKGVDRNGIHASYDAGILRVSLPKTEDKKAETRSIEIQ